jgi:hypothetical protein
MTVTAVDILGAAVDSCVATTLDFVLQHLIILELRDSYPQKAVEGVVKVKWQRVCC